jgi:hypothetical protein
LRNSPGPRPARSPGDPWTDAAAGRQGSWSSCPAEVRDASRPVGDEAPQWECASDVESALSSALDRSSFAATDTGSGLGGEAGSAKAAVCSGCAISRNALIKAGAQLCLGCLRLLRTLTWRSNGARTLCAAVRRVGPPAGSCPVWVCGCPPHPWPGARSDDGRCLRRAVVASSDIPCPARIRGGGSVDPRSGPHRGLTIMKSSGFGRLVPAGADSRPSRRGPESLRRSPGCNVSSYMEMAWNSRGWPLERSR